MNADDGGGAAAEEPSGADAPAGRHYYVLDLVLDEWRAGWVLELGLRGEALAITALHEATALASTGATTGATSGATSGARRGGTSGGGGSSHKHHLRGDGDGHKGGDAPTPASGGRVAEVSMALAPARRGGGYGDEVPRNAVRVRGRGKLRGITHVRCHAPPPPLPPRPPPSPRPTLPPAWWLTPPPPPHSKTGASAGGGPTDASASGSRDGDYKQLVHSLARTHA